MIADLGYSYHPLPTNKLFCPPPPTFMSCVPTLSNPFPGVVLAVAGEGYTLKDGHGAHRLHSLESDVTFD